MRNASELTGMDNMAYLATVPDGETIVSITNVENYLYVATDKHLYVLVDNKRLEPIN